MREKPGDSLIRLLSEVLTVDQVSQFHLQEKMKSHLSEEMWRIVPIKLMGWLKLLQRGKPHVLFFDNRTKWAMSLRECLNNSQVLHEYFKDYDGHFDFVETLGEESMSKICQRADDLYHLRILDG